MQTVQLSGEKAQSPKTQAQLFKKLIGDFNAAAARINGDNDVRTVDSILDLVVQIALSKSAGFSGNRCQSALIAFFNAVAKHTHFNAALVSSFERRVEVFIASLEQRLSAPGELHLAGYIGEFRVLEYVCNVQPCEPALSHRVARIQAIYTTTIRRMMSHAETHGAGIFNSNGSISVVKSVAATVQKLRYGWDGVTQSLLRSLLELLPHVRASKAVPSGVGVAIAALAVHGGDGDAIVRTFLGEDALEKRQHGRQQDKKASPELGMSLTSLRSLASSLPRVCQYAIVRGLCVARASGTALVAGGEHSPLVGSVLPFLIRRCKGFATIVSVDEPSDGDRVSDSADAFELSVLLQSLHAVLEIARRNPGLLSLAAQNEVMEVIATQWECMISAVQMWVKDCFNTLVAIHRAGVQPGRREEGKDDSFFVSVAARTLELGWSHKGKYGILKSLLDDVSVETILRLAPHFIAELVDSLCDQVVKTAASQLFAKVIEVLKANEAASSGVMRSAVFPSIVASLLRHAQQNGFPTVAKFCIVPLLRLLPSALVSLLDALSSVNGASRALSDSQMTVALIILTVARQLGILDEEAFAKGEARALITTVGTNAKTEPATLPSVPLPLGAGATLSSVIGTCLAHTDEYLVTTALELVCVAQRPAEPPSRFELDAVRRWTVTAFRHNTKCSRQQNTNLLSKFLQRVRAARTAAVLAKRKERTKHSDIMPAESQAPGAQPPRSKKRERKQQYRAQQSELGKQIVAGGGRHASTPELLAFVHALGDDCCASFHPTASEERTTFAVSAFEALVNVFPDAPQTAELGLYTAPHFESLLTPLAASTGKTRQTALRCLNAFPALAAFSDKSHILRYVSRALQLCLSPRMSEAEAGSSMIEILVEKLANDNVTNLITDNNDDDDNTDNINNTNNTNDTTHQQSNKSTFSGYIPKFCFERANIAVELAELHGVTRLEFYAGWYEELLALLKYNIGHALSAEDTPATFLSTLLAAARHYPLHGTLAALRAVITLAAPLLKQEETHSAHPHNEHTAPSPLLLRWRADVRQTISLCRSAASVAIAPVSSAAPEGFTDRQLDDGEEDGEGLDGACFGEGEAMNTALNGVAERSADVPPNSLQFNSNSGGQMIRSFCWLAVKEISLLVGTLVYALPLPPLSYAVDKAALGDADGIDDDSPLGQIASPFVGSAREGVKPWHHYAPCALLTGEQIALCEDMLLAMLLASRHKGAIEMAYEGLLLFCKGVLLHLKRSAYAPAASEGAVGAQPLAEESRLVVSLPLGELPRALVACTLSHARRIATRTHDTPYASGALFARRSAGTPLALCAVLAAEAEAAERGTVWVSGGANAAHELLGIAMTELLALCGESEAAETTDLGRYACFSFERSMERVLPISLLSKVQLKASTNITRDSFLDVDPKVHAIHTMNAMLRNKTVADTLDPYLYKIFFAVFDGLSSPLWGVRSAATLCYYAVVRRSASNKTFKHFFAQQPQLLPRLLDQLSKHASRVGASEGDVLQSSLFASLTLLSTLQHPHPLDGENDERAAKKNEALDGEHSPEGTANADFMEEENDTESEKATGEFRDREHGGVASKKSAASLSPTQFISPIMRIATTQPFAKVREMASNAIPPLLLSHSIERAFEMGLDLFVKATTYNQLHGALLVLRSLLLHGALLPHQPAQSRHRCALLVLSRIGGVLPALVDPSKRGKKRPCPPAISACACQLCEALLLALRGITSDATRPTSNACHGHAVAETFVKQVASHARNGLFIEKGDYAAERPDSPFFASLLRRELCVSPVQLCVHFKRCTHLALYLSTTKEWRAVVQPILGTTEFLVEQLVSSKSSDIREEAAKFCNDCAKRLVQAGEEQSHNPLLSSSLLPASTSASFSFADKDRAKNFMRFENLDCAEFTFGEIMWDELRHTVLNHLAAETDQKALCRFFKFVSTISSKLQAITFASASEKQALLSALSRFLTRDAWASSDALEVFAIVLAGDVSASRTEIRREEGKGSTEFIDILFKTVTSWSAASTPVNKRLAAAKATRCYINQVSKNENNSKRRFLRPIITLLRDDDLDIRCLTTLTLAEYARSMEEGTKTEPTACLSPLASLDKGVELMLYSDEAELFVRQSLFSFEDNDAERTFFEKPYSESSPQFLFTIEPDNFYEEPASFAKLVLQHAASSSHIEVLSRVLSETGKDGKTRAQRLCERMTSAAHWLERYESLCGTSHVYLHSQWMRWLTTEPVVFVNVAKLVVAFRAVVAATEYATAHSHKGAEETSSCDIGTAKRALSALSAQVELHPFIERLCTEVTTESSLQ